MLYSHSLDVVKHCGTRQCENTTQQHSSCMDDHTCRKWPAAPPWMEASPPGEAPAEWPVLLKKDVKVPLLPPKKPLLCCGDALQRGKPFTSCACTFAPKKSHNGIQGIHFLHHLESSTRHITAMLVCQLCFHAHAACLSCLLHSSLKWENQAVAGSGQDNVYGRNQHAEAQGAQGCLT